MNVFDKRVSTGIPVPCELDENYVSILLSELAETSQMSVSEARSEIDRLNLSDFAYLTIFNRISDGLEMVTGYIF